MLCRVIITNTGIEQNDSLEWYHVKTRQFSTNGSSFVVPRSICVYSGDGTDYAVDAATYCSCLSVASYKNINHSYQIKNKKTSVTIR